MILKKIKIQNFKNLTDVNIELSPKINCFVGYNGAGKTNFLDAVFFVANTRSFNNHIDIQNIKSGEKYLFIEADFEKNNSFDKVTASVSDQNGKIFKLNNKKHKKISEHYGLFPVVMITPYDVNLVSDGSETRRNFMDAVISMCDRDFLQNLIDYKRILLQRNTLLKQNLSFNELKNFLLIYDAKLSKLAPKIYKKRKEFINDFLPLFFDYYKKISQSDEIINIEYKSDLENASLETLLEQNLNNDIKLKRTTKGIHKDDLIFSIHDLPLKKTASQGQQKTFVTAMKFAKSDFIKKNAGIRPILLLDDIFDKLDAKRVANVVNLVADNHFGQIFITHTDETKLKDILNPVGVDFKIFNVENGNIS